MRLVLFDIDGTLVASNGAGRAAMRHALIETFGTAGAIEDYRFGGSCDRYTVFTLMRDAGIHEDIIEQHFPLLGDLMAQYLLEKGTSHLVEALEGGQLLYEEVTRHQSMILGIVTGNFEESGRAKLRLGGYADSSIVVGAYGNESDDRADLPHLALERTHAYTNINIPPEHVTIIGDTTSDIACARAVGARAIAVSTGSDHAGTLRQAKPDLLLPDLTDTAAVLDFILG